MVPCSIAAYFTEHPYGRMVARGRTLAGQDRVQPIRNLLSALASVLLTPRTIVDSQG